MISLVLQTPAGETKSSTSYHDGSFYLTPSSPVTGGNYSCQVPSHLLSDVCITDTQRDDNTVKVRVMEDEFKARLSQMSRKPRTERTAQDGSKMVCHIPTHLLSDVCITDTQRDDNTVKDNVIVGEFKARLSQLSRQKTVN